MKLEVVMLGIGLPVAGLAASVILWLMVRQSTDDARANEVRLGFRVTALAFAAYLIWLRLTSLPGRYHTSFVALVLILLSMSGAIAASSGLVLTTACARGPLRITGTILSLLALGYAFVSGFALLTGRAA
jgi:hypothetical protein